MSFGLATLFLAALLAATLFPAQSEGMLAVMIASGDHPVVLLVAVASLGNTLGAVVNWALGRLAAGLRDRPWFLVGASALARAEAWYRRFGIWSLLASPLPFIGDPLTVIGGVLRAPLRLFLPLVAFAKTARYLLLAWSVEAIVGATA